MIKKLVCLSFVLSFSFQFSLCTIISTLRLAAFIKAQEQALEDQEDQEIAEEMKNYIHECRMEDREYWQKNPQEKPKMKMVLCKYHLVHCPPNAE
jgi:hypothetical protein